MGRGLLVTGPREWLAGMHVCMFAHSPTRMSVAMSVEGVRDPTHASAATSIVGIHGPACASVTASISGVCGTMDEQQALATPLVRVHPPHTKPSLLSPSLRSRPPTLKDWGTLHYSIGLALSEEV